MPIIETLKYCIKLFPAIIFSFQDTSCLELADNWYIHKTIHY